MKNLVIICLLVFSYTSINAQNTAQELLETAAIQAKKENKNIFVKFEASWCGWCKRMTKQMESEDLKASFEENYVITHIVVLESKKNKNLETPGGNQLLASYNAEKAGLPFFVILDSDGNLLEDSFFDVGKNLGCPASKEEVAFFIEMLKNTSSLDEKALEQITNIFTKK